MILNNLNLRGDEDESCDCCDDDCDCGDCPECAGAKDEAAGNEEGEEVTSKMYGTATGNDDDYDDGYRDDR